MLVGNPADHLISASDPRRLSQGSGSAYLKIGEGCNRTCAFCAIPSFRGALRSRPIADLVDEATQLAALGVAEVNLVSQDTTSWGRDLSARPALVELLHALAGVPGLRWIRLLYLYPESMPDAFLDLMNEEPRVLEYVDMPLQHASDQMLRTMRRGHGGERLRRLVDKVRQRVPSVVFRSTFIVGHPGESDADFRQLCDFVRWAELDHIGVFRYSHEEGTASGAMADLVPEAVAVARRDELMEIQRRVSRRKLAALVGKQIEVLVEGESEESGLLLSGRTRGQAPEVDGVVHLANGVAAPGQIRQALVTGSADYDLVADLLDDQGRRDAPPGANADPGAYPGADSGADRVKLPIV